MKQASVARSIGPFFPLIKKEICPRVCPGVFMAQKEPF